jgi:NADP-dependent 3-hydroxy acid dehydrogenase YdfG
MSNGKWKMEKENGLLFLPTAPAVCRSWCPWRLGGLTRNSRYFMSYWTNKVVMITGASSGIGRGLAIQMGLRGAKLGLVARRVEAIDEAVREIEAAGGKAMALPADVQRVDSISTVADKLRSGFGAIDVLVANAGVGPTRDAADFRAEEVAEVMNVNVIGASNSVATVIPEMIARGSGHLVAISSLAAYRGLP